MPPIPMPLNQVTNPGPGATADQRAFPSTDDCPADRPSHAANDGPLFLAVIVSAWITPLTSRTRTSENSEK